MSKPLSAKLLKDISDYIHTSLKLEGIKPNSENFYLVILGILCSVIGANVDNKEDFKLGVEAIIVDIQSLCDSIIKDRYEKDEKTSSK